MAKTEQVVEVKEKVVNMVAMADGSQRNFGERGKLLSTHEVNSHGFVITFHLVTGEQVVYSYTGELELPELLAEMAAFGVANKIKASTAGTKPEELLAVVTAKKEEIEAGNFVSRTGGGEILSALSQLQTAYAIANEIDYTTREGIAAINAVFAQLSKEEVSAIRKDPKVKMAVLNLQRAKLEAELAGK